MRAFAYPRSDCANGSHYGPCDCANGSHNSTQMVVTTETAQMAVTTGGFYSRFRSLVRIVASIERAWRLGRVFACFLAAIRLLA